MDVPKDFGETESSYEIRCSFIKCNIEWYSQELLLVYSRIHVNKIRYDTTYSPNVELLYRQMSENLKRSIK